MTKFIELHRAVDLVEDRRIFINIARISYFYEHGKEGCVITYSDPDDYHHVLETYDEIKVLLAAN